MNKFRQLRIAALLFTIVFLISSVPISGYGKESTQSAIGITEGSSDMDVEEYGASPNDETQEELVLSEVVSRREENVKHFDLGHGRFQAVAYGNAVHRKDENGVWHYFDMVPEETEVREGAPIYTGKVCVIGSGLKEDDLKELFH